MSVITESEKKRLRSLKEKKQAFKTKGQLIQQALSNLVSLLLMCCIIFLYDLHTHTHICIIKIKKNIFFLFIYLIYTKCAYFILTIITFLG